MESLKWHFLLYLPVYVKQSYIVLGWMCPALNCIWRRVNSGVWILRDFFLDPEPRDARTSAFCFAQCANPFLHLPTQWLSCFLLISLHISLSCVFQAGWQRRSFESHIFCLFWMVFDQVAAGFQCFCTVVFFTIVQKLAPRTKQKVPRKLEHTVWGYVAHGYIL